jgi:hypothetical protein
MLKGDILKKKIGCKSFDEKYTQCIYTKNTKSRNHNLPAKKIKKVQAYDSKCSLPSKLLAMFYRPIS